MPELDPNSAAVFDGLFGLPFSPEESRVLVVPVPWEATCSYRAGTAAGPAAVLEASRQVDLLDRDTGRPYQAKIAMLPIPTELRALSDQACRRALPVIEAGGAGDDPDRQQAVVEVEGLCGRMNSWVHDTVRGALEAGQLPAVLGGDHSVSLGAIAAVAERHPDLGVLHLDAHADLRSAYEGFRFSHASIMRNVVETIPGVARLVQVGIRDYCDAEDAFIRANPERIRTYFDSDLRHLLFEGGSWGRLVGRMIADLPSQVYLSFDIDGLDPSLCPHTGTPVPGGLSFAETVALLRGLVESGRRIVGFDLTEVAPDAAGQSDWDANVAARLLYKMIGFALLCNR
jgi:agmatinase